MRLSSIVDKTRAKKDCEVPVQEKNPRLTDTR